MLRFLFLALVAYEAAGKFENEDILVCSTDPKGRPLQDFQLPPAYGKSSLQYIDGLKSSLANAVYVAPGPTHLTARPIKKKYAQRYRPTYEDYLAEFIKEKPGQNAPPAHGEYLAEMIFEHSKSAGTRKQTRQLKPNQGEKYLDEQKQKYNPEELKNGPSDSKDLFCDKLDLDPKIIAKLAPGYDPKFFSNYEPLKQSDPENKNLKSYDDLKNDPIDFDLPKDINFDAIYDTRVPKLDFEPLNIKSTKFDEFNSKNDRFHSKNSKFEYEPVKELNKKKEDKYEPIYDIKGLEPIRDYNGENFKPIKYDTKKGKLEYEPIFDTKTLEPIRDYNSDKSLKYDTKNTKFAYEPIKDFKNDEIKGSKQIYDTKNSKYSYEPVEELKNKERDLVYDTKNSKYVYEPIERKNDEVKESKYDQIYDRKNSKYDYEPIREFKNDEIKESKYDQIYEGKNSKYDYEPIRELKNDEIKGSKYDQIYDRKISKYDYEPIREIKNDKIPEGKHDEIYDSKGSSYESFREQNHEKSKGFKYGSIYDTKNSKYEYAPIREYKNHNSKYSKFENYEPINSKSDNHDLQEDKKYERYEPIRELEKASNYEMAKFEEKYPTFNNRRHENDSFEEEKRDRLPKAPTFTKLKVESKKGPQSNYYMETSNEYVGATKRPCLPPPVNVEETIESCDCD